MLELAARCIGRLPLLNIDGSLSLVGTRTGANRRRLSIGAALFSLGIVELEAESLSTALLRARVWGTTSLALFFAIETVIDVILFRPSLLNFSHFFHELAFTSAQFSTT